MVMLLVVRYNQMITRNWQSSYPALREMIGNSESEERDENKAQMGL